MRTTDYIQQAFFGLTTKKLRTCLTVGGIMISIGALSCMLAFGFGMQKNITKNFEELELFNYMNVSPQSNERPRDPDEKQPVSDDTVKPRYSIDDALIQEIREIEGIETAFPEERFSGLIQYCGREEYTMVQVLPAYVYNQKLIELVAGEFYDDNDVNSIVISRSMLDRMNMGDAEDAIGKKIQLITSTMDLGIANFPKIILSVKKGKLPLTNHTYTFTIAGVVKRADFMGVVPVRSDVYICSAASKNIKKLRFISLSELFQTDRNDKGYRSVTVRIASVKYHDQVRDELTKKGVKVFSMLDHLEEIKKGFLIVDTFLIAVSMIGITISSLGIINTMLMSVLERYRQIGIFKALGATNHNIRMIFLFESGIIGFVGGVLGLVLGYLVSILIGFIIVSIDSNIPDMNFFYFSFWLCFGCVLFSVCISLISGTYPAMRASRVDPIKALHHE